MKVTAAAATDIGRIRERNEDSYLVEDPLFAVADGMGGHRGGEVASRLALETLEKLLRHGAGDLTEQVQEANRAVFEKSMRDRRVAGMGTTLTVALVEERRVRFAHVGDSRAYLLRDGELHQLTEDHTLVRRMVTEGEITEEEAKVHPHRNVMTRAVGVDMWVDIDDLFLEAHEGDRLLLCTDGLTGMITEGHIRRILDETPDPQEAADLLVAAANEAGGVDNITVVVLDFTNDDPTTTADAKTTHADGAGPSRSPGRGWHGGRSEGPAPSRRRVPARRVAFWVGGVVAVVVVGLVGLRVYVDRQWYVGVADGHVAIYRGIPTQVAGFRMHRVVVETTISADVAESLEFYHDLADGITADDRQAADAIIEQIRRDVARLQQKAAVP